MSLINFINVTATYALSTEQGSATEKTGEAQPLVFICHKGLHYSRVEVMYAFKGYLDEPRPVDNKSLFPVMLKEIGYTPEKYDALWKKMYFRRALFMPKMGKNDESTINWVSQNYAGIGYVKKAPLNNPDVEVCGNF